MIVTYLWAVELFVKNDFLFNIRLLSILACINTNMGKIQSLFQKCFCSLEGFLFFSSFTHTPHGVPWINEWEEVIKMARGKNGKEWRNVGKREKGMFHWNTFLDWGLIGGMEKIFKGGNYQVSYSWHKNNMNKDRVLKLWEVWVNLGHDIWA